VAQATLYQILDQLPTLEVDELRQLNQAVQERLAPQEQAQKREAFHQALLASGLVRQIKPPRRADDSPRRLIEVQGKPVSETIIEERR
jgi:uncharacterized protein involved in exopolysaccharide biosynthesis